MKRKSLLMKVLIAVALTSLSVVIDVFFKYILSIPNFGLPFYAIPLIIGSIALGPSYGVMMALVGDAIGVLLSGYTYLPLYALAAVAWGVIPGLFMLKTYSPFKLAISIFLAYLFANLGNSLATYVYYGYGTTLLTLGIRLALLPFNSVLIFIVTKELYRRLAQIFPEYMSLKLNNAHS